MTFQDINCIIYVTVHLSTVILMLQKNQQKATIHLPASTTAVQFTQVVAKRFLYDPETFELILQKNNETVSACLIYCI